MKERNWTPKGMVGHVVYRMGKRIPAEFASLELAVQAYQDAIGGSTRVAVLKASSDRFHEKVDMLASLADAYARMAGPDEEPEVKDE